MRRLWQTFKHQRPLVSSPLMSSSRASSFGNDKEMMANERARANEKAGAEGGDEGEGLVDAPVDPPIDPVIDPTV